MKSTFARWRFRNRRASAKTGWQAKLNASLPLVDGERFIVKIAESEFEMLEAEQLRYRVFMAEQKRGTLEELLPGAPLPVDQDVYDANSLHLLVVEKNSLQVVGTYRVRPGTLIDPSLGFYSQRQYEIAGLRPLANSVCEVGRSCVDREYRSGSVVALLWSGLAALQKRLGFRYLMGCASLEVEDAGVAWRMYEYFRDQKLLSGLIACQPRAGFELPKPEHMPEMAEKELKKAMPPLLKGYLRLGAKIGGLPSYDREFGSIDFMIFFDFDNGDERYLKHFQNQ